MNRIHKDSPGTPGMRQAGPLGPRPSVSAIPPRPHVSLYIYKESGCLSILRRPFHTLTEKNLVVLGRLCGQRLL